MLRTWAISPELLGVVQKLMELESLRNFRLVGGSALALQLGHRESKDIDFFSSNEFSSDDICVDLVNKFCLKEPVKVRGGIMVSTIIDHVKVDVMDHKYQFIRNPVVEDGIRMAHTEEIAAMKIKTTCDPFSGRKTLKDLVDIAVLLDIYTVKEIMGFFSEKYPTMAPYKENVILELNKNYDHAERYSVMPKMHNGLTWEKTKLKINAALQDYFNELLKEREQRVNARNSDK